MAIVNSDFLAATLTSFRATFNSLFPAAMAAQLWPSLVMRVESNTDTETHNWLGSVPVMQNVTRGELTISGLEAYSYSLTNQTYKAAIEVKRTTLEDDKLARIAPKQRQLPQEAAAHPGRLIMDLFETPGTAFDGTAFFADTRVIGKSANIDNEVEGAYGAGTVAEFAAGLTAAAARMFAFQDDQGRPMELVPNVIVVPPALMEVAWQHLNRGDGTTGPVPGMPAGAFKTFNASGYTVINNARLTVSDDWYVLHVGADEMRPFIFQNRVSPSVDGTTDPNDVELRERERVLYSVRGRYTVGVGDPRLAVKVVDV